MKKILYTLTGAALSLCLFTGCTDLLDTLPTNKPAASTMWTTENLTDMGISGIYANLRNMCYNTNNGNGEAVGFYGFEAYGMSGQMVRNVTFTSGVSSSSGLFSNTWKKMYEGIHRANDAIVNIPVKSPVSNEKKGRLVAEARFLRAFHYYMLNQLFKGVPYYDAPITIEEATKGQETEEFIWNKVIEDLTACIAEPNLPNNDFKEGRATKGAAYALRGKVYMCTKEYAKAADDFAKVGECGYKLFQGGYKELFLEKNERCEEMIFSVQNIALTGYGNKVQRFCGTNSASGGGTTVGWNDYMATPDIVDLYEYGDGTTFDWKDIIPEYYDIPVKAREVFFLRDIKKDGKEISAEKVTTAVKDRLTALEAIHKGVSAYYLEEGNEARIRKAYEGRDPRLGMNVITPYSTFRGWRNTPAEEFVSTYRIPTGKDSSREDRELGDLWPNNANLNSNNSYYFHRKFVWEGYNTVQRDYGPTDEPIIRYADVLLAWAEALIELDKLSEAADKVNMVRGRKSVDMPDVVYSGQADLREKVRDERRREFVNEGVNFFDEMRWGTFKEKKFYDGNGAKSVWGAIIGGTAYVWPTTADLNVWPVPVDEVGRNSNLTKTPGWAY
ncbi:RagB/SusD family nutrient uptake outer membrane protein [Bacteroides sp. 519]|uniref:RagB/SusD family nutrient uptake outer membrane protein n=1 Tax=Bacteroides sp. 519 TaxID=2302937 RepID=UPI0013D54694|nr:RagB/SusD family nutrient uptake outer membrane protein [Bacteroides sp. 519]NDV60498.1 RagB/SusD family nutrient uptake outer membrane protein [Bacteroides sp. 519]